MKRSIRVRYLWSAPLFSLLAHWTAIAQAQVEAIDPNPTMPRDIGGRLTYRGFSDSGFKLGRTSARDENPAETLLKSIDGTNYGRATGHSLFSRGVIERATSKDARRPSGDSPQTARMYSWQPGSSGDRGYERRQGNAERQRAYATQALEGRRAAAKMAAPTTERHAATDGTRHAPRNPGKNVQRKAAK